MSWIPTDYQAPPSCSGDHRWKAEYAPIRSPFETVRQVCRRCRQEEKRVADDMVQECRAAIKRDLDRLVATTNTGMSFDLGSTIQAITCGLQILLLKVRIGHEAYCFYCEAADDPEIKWNTTIYRTKSLLTLQRIVENT